MLKKFKELFLSPRYPIQTFTYYIPGPPERKTNYRETQFDRDFYSFINQGYKIISINSVPHHGPKQTGMWFIATVQALNENAAKLNLGEHFENTQAEDLIVEYVGKENEK